MTATSVSPFLFLIIPKKGDIKLNMGTNKTNTIEMGDALFTRTQRQVLGLLFSHPDRSYYLNEIVRFAEVGSGSVQRELERLASAGLLSTRKVGNQKHYQANQQSPIFTELCGLVLKSFGIAELLRQALAGLSGQIQAAFVYGSIAKGTTTAASDIDVMIIAEELSYADLFTSLATIETKLGRTISPSLYQPEEFQNKMTTDNNFVKRVMEQPKIFLIGSEDDLPPLPLRTAPATPALPLHRCKAADSSAPRA